MKQILLIDICGTITTKNTTLDFISFSNLELGNLKYLVGRIAWRFFNKDYIRIWSVKKLNGLTKYEISNLVNKYVAQLEFDREVLDLIYEYKKNGFELYFVSATLDVIAEEISKKINVTNTYASRLKFENEYCKGVIQNDLLDNKYPILSHFFNDKNEVVMISDNYGDYRVMEMCNYSYAVVRKKKALNYWKGKNVTIINRI